MASESNAAAAEAAAAASAGAGARDPLMASAQQFRLMHQRLKENPITGLGDQQRDRYVHFKRQVDGIRKAQEELFKNQFFTFPQNSDSYSHIQDSFQIKDADVDTVVAKMNDLSKAIEKLNSTNQ